MLRDMDREEPAPVELTASTPHPKNPADFSASPQGGGEGDAKNLASDGHMAGRREGESRIAFRDGEVPGELEILSVDAGGACIVHKVRGLGLANLLVKAAEAQRRGMA